MNRGLPGLAAAVEVFSIPTGVEARLRGIRTRAGGEGQRRHSTAEGQNARQLAPFIATNATRGIHRKGQTNRVAVPCDVHVTGDATAACARGAVARRAGDERWHGCLRPVGPETIVAALVARSCGVSPSVAVDPCGVVGNTNGVIRGARRDDEAQEQQGPRGTTSPRRVMVREPGHGAFAGSCGGLSAMASGNRRSNPPTRGIEPQPLSRRRRDAYATISCHR
jgi:hypothetical protein